MSVDLIEFDLDRTSLNTSDAPFSLHFRLKSLRIDLSDVPCIREIFVATAETLTTLDLYIGPNSVLTAIVANIYLVQDSLRTLKINTVTLAIASNYSDILTACAQVTDLMVYSDAQVTDLKKLLAHLSSATLRTLLLDEIIHPHDPIHIYDSLLTLPALVNVKVLRFESESDGWQSRWGDEADF